MNDDIKRIKITNTCSYTCWYKIGEEYNVRDYRYNSSDYWEIEGWDGNTDTSSKNFWIYKKDSIIIDEKVFKIDLDELMTL